MPFSVSDVDNGSKNICHHSDDDWRGGKLKKLCAVDSVIMHNVLRIFSLHIG
jgi:hypothetical protein